MASSAGTSSGLARRAACGCGGSRRRELRRRLVARSPSGPASAGSWPGELPRWTGTFIASCTPRYGCPTLQDTRSPGRRTPGANVRVWPIGTRPLRLGSRGTTGFPNRPARPSFSTSATSVAKMPPPLKWTGFPFTLPVTVKESGPFTGTELEPPVEVEKDVGSVTRFGCAAIAAQALAGSATSPLAGSHLRWKSARPPVAPKLAMPGVRSPEKLSLTTRIVRFAGIGAGVANGRISTVAIAATATTTAAISATTSLRRLARRFASATSGSSERGKRGRRRVMEPVSLD